MVGLNKKKKPYQLSFCEFLGFLGVKNESLAQLPRDLFMQIKKLTLTQHFQGGICLLSFVVVVHQNIIKIHRNFTIFHQNSTKYYQNVTIIH